MSATKFDKLGPDQTKCKRGCKYYSINSQSCDYRLKTGQGRGCPVESCTRYEKGEKEKPAERMKRHIR